VKNLLIQAKNIATFNKIKTRTAPSFISEDEVKDIQETIESYTARYVYFNNDRNIPKATEVLIEFLLYMNVLVLKQGVESCLNDVLTIMLKDYQLAKKKREPGKRIYLRYPNGEFIEKFGERESVSVEIDNLINKVIEEKESRSLKY
jgi:hypothetical protein